MARRRRSAGLLIVPGQVGVVAKFTVQNDLSALGCAKVNEEERGGRREI